MPLSEVRILPMQPEHIPQIGALELAIFSDPWSEASIRYELENSLSLWLTALDEGGTVLGYVGSQTAFEDADVLNLAVADSARRRGLGAALMLELEKRLIQKGAERATLEVRVSNAPAIALYEKLGYVQVGLRRGYYEKPREDAKILQKELKP